jgi:signal transduction histidine kinase
VEAATADLQPILERDNAVLQSYIAPDLPLIDGDALQLVRVYQNLIANALKHNPPGLTLILEAKPTDNQLHCTVTDDGIGIPPEQCDRLFDPYFRGSQKPKSVGLGLGLYLCRQIIEAHGGAIGVRSRVGEGTTFWFTLPLHQ